MIKEYIEIFKNYYKLINKDKNKLIPFYICYMFNIIVELIIPIFIAKITENLTNSLLLATNISIIMYFYLKTMNSIFSYFDMHIYSNFFKNNYITLYKKVISTIYNFDESTKKNFSMGRMTNSLTTDIINVGEMADNILSIILNIFKSFIVIIYFIKINIFFAIFILLVDIIYIRRSNYLNNQTIKYLNKQVKTNDKLIGLVNQTLNGLKDIQTLDISNKLNEKYNSLYKSWKSNYIMKRKYQIYKKTILKCFLTLIKTVIYFICVYLIFNNKMTIGIMLLIISYFDSLLTSSETIMSSSESIKSQNISVIRLNEILQTSSKLASVNSISNTAGLIEFKNISFSYTNKRLLENLNFTILPNQITVITGENGAGKTTIIDLILKMYNPTQGEILLDNININTIDKKSYLKNISILNQETYLFNLSIRQNFNLINKDINMQENICKFVGIDNFINKLPKGYDTILYENSNNISGGQKKLLSIARMLLKEAKILIFDEATSSLDSNMTKHICNILTKLKKNHTIIVITHKAEIIKIADNIIKITNKK